MTRKAVESGDVCDDLALGVETSPSTCIDSLACGIAAGGFSVSAVDLLGARDSVAAYRPL